MRRWDPDLHPRARDGRFGRTPGGGAVTTASRGRGDTTVRQERNGWPADTGGGAPNPDTTMLPAAELRATLLYGTDGFAYHRKAGWNALLQRAIDDPRTPKFMAAIAARGMEPLQILDEKVPDGAGGQELEREIRNGNHRLALAMLMGVRNIPISRRDYETGGEHDDSKVAVQLGDPPVTDLPDGAGAVIAAAQALIRAGSAGSWSHFEDEKPAH